MFLQNDTDATIIYEVNNGERKSLSPGESVTLTRVKSLHLHPYVPPPTPVPQREPGHQRRWEPGAVEKPPKDAPIEVRLKALIMRAIEDVEEKEIVPSADLVNDLGADSIDLVEFVLFMEEEFGIDINDDDAMQILTVGEALEFLHDKGIV